jgi:transcriptional regulator GlxA family with amidase domain
MEPVSLPSLLHVVGRAEDGVEDGLRRMLAGWPPEGRAGALRLEAEAKALAVRFWSAAEATEAGRMAKPAAHPEVRRARVWLELNYARPDALEVFYGELTLSPNHFRLLFRRETGETVQAMLARLRLRRARYLVRETTWPMKRIAAETGFADPLYFSSCYRDFWGSAPTADREEGGAA